VEFGSAWGGVELDPSEAETISPKPKSSASHAVQPQGHGMPCTYGAACWQCVPFRGSELKLRHNDATMSHYRLRRSTRAIPAL
jgi:hypothetical protein